MSGSILSPRKKPSYCSSLISALVHECVSSAIAASVGTMQTFNEASSVARLARVIVEIHDIILQSGNTGLNWRLQRQVQLQSKRLGCNRGRTVVVLTRAVPFLGEDKFPALLQCPPECLSGPTAAGASGSKPRYHCARFLQDRRASPRCCLAAPMP